jgi:hypothetical protein
MVLLCRLVFATDSDLAWRALFTVNFPAICVLGVMAVMRWSGWRVVRLSPEVVTAMNGEKAIKLGDLFLLTVAMALISAAAGTSVSLRQSLQTGIHWSDALATVIGLLILGVTSTATLHRSPRWFAQSLLVSGLCLAVLYIEPLLRESVYNRIEVYIAYGTTEARTILSVTVALFVCGYIYRLRGYRWASAV